MGQLVFVPIGVLIRQFAPPSFWLAIEATPADDAALGWSNFIMGNLLPVTIGNIIGGAGLVGGTYWFVYLRPRPRSRRKEGGSSGLQFA